MVADEAKVREAVVRFGDGRAVEVRPGWFADTFPGAVPEVGEVAVLHVDGDRYESVKLTLESWHPVLSPGAFVVIDDYGTWQGSRTATDEFLAIHGITGALTARSTAAVCTGANSGN